MPATLADSLELVLPEVPAALVPAETHAGINELARGLAPIHRCGFEVRLGTSSQVDFQQGIGVLEGEPKTLLGHLSRLRRDGPGWAGLIDLVSDWAAASSPLSGDVQDLWLEFDRAGAAPPSVFVGLTRAGGDRQLAFAALDRLVGHDGWARFRPAAQRCFDGCSDGSHVSHVGLMLGRAAPFLRVNVARLEPEGLGDYLDRVGWPGRPAEPVELMERLDPLADEVTICLDVGDELLPRLGFECRLVEQPPLERRWAELLGELVEAGWCTDEKRDALLGWPQLVLPREGGNGWPADLLRASLLRPQDHFTSLERRLSHVKVVYEPERPTEAKGYFGYLHRWLRPELEQDEPPRPNGLHRPRRRDVAGAIAAATDFLLDIRTHDGWWRDFYGTRGASEDWSSAFGWSDEWVTAFAATALAGTGEARALDAALRAWDLLVERRVPLGGWGYNRISPVDADSTSWALRLAAALGLTDSAPARKGLRALAMHELPDGGLATYVPAECPRPRSERMTPPNGSLAGWCRTSHTCVTAVAASLGGERRLEYLRSAQQGDGSWTAYWWRDDEYATALGAEALAAAGDRGPVESAVRWASARAGPDGAVSGSPFATAWCVRLMLLGDDTREPLGRSIAWLLQSQDPDGGWPATARMVVPRPDVTDPEASPVPPALSLDDARTFTTATVISALARSTP
ncbi:MAG: hypothetical protein ACJ766_01695 [Thermoleophilaceae bacterium]